MKTVLTIDFDIIMHPCIDIYNDADMSVDEYLLKYDFLGFMKADLLLYKELTNYIININSNRIHFIYNHNEVADDLLLNNEKVNLYNIDYHHDIGYGNIKWNIPLITYHEGNWVKKLWDEHKINHYIWLKDYNSSSVPNEAKKYITEQHFINNYNINNIIPDELYICLSPEWVPADYRVLYKLWQDLIYNK